jgi:hypothetical protein
MITTFISINNIITKPNSFIGKLSDVVNQQKFEVISATIQKEALKKHYRYDNNPYHIALKFCVECLFNFLIASTQNNHIMTKVIKLKFLETLNSFQIIRFFEYAKRQYKY